MGIFLEDANFMELGLVDANISENKKLSLEVVNNVDSWVFRMRTDSVKFF